MPGDGQGHVPSSFELGHVVEGSNKVGPNDPPPPYVAEQPQDKQDETTVAVTKHAVRASKVWTVTGVIVSICVIVLTTVIVVLTTTNAGSGSPATQTTHAGPTTPEPPPVIDGHWSVWRPWSTCNATCGGGMRSRQRTCDNPAPDNGGKACAGPNMEVEACNTFDCPNCNRTCDQGSLVDCAYCSCDGHVIFGHVLNALNQPLEGVDVYHTDRLWTPLTSTDDAGYYSVFDVCGQGVTLRFELDHYGPIEESVQPVNDSASQADAMLTKYVLPSFTSHPLPKGRFAGQDVTLCCNASGVPQPKKYTWYHNGDYIEGQSETDQMTLTSLTVDQTGLYKCKASSEAGEVYSNEAVLQVKEKTDGVSDTCNPTPDDDWYHILGDCLYTDSDGVQHKKINKGRCPVNNRCINTTWNEFDDCDDGHTWCCGIIQSTSVTVDCSGFTYQVPVITQCGCINCLIMKDTFVKGRAFGRARGGTRIPLKLANIYYKKQLIGSTGIDGSFDVKLPPETTSPAVLEFEDQHFKEFFRTVKTVWFKKGTTIQQDVRLPLKPNPLPFHAGENMNVDLGGDDGLEPLVALNFSSTKLYRSDGSMYDGEVNLFTNLIDPRNAESLLSAPVDFTYHREDGDVESLITYGAIGFSVEDQNGDPLDLKGNISWAQSTKGFTIPVNEDGEPDVYLWVLDDVTGNWIEVAPFRFLDSREKGLRNDDYIVIDGIEIGDLPLSEMETRRDTINVNCDRSCPRGYYRSGNKCYRDYTVEVAKPTCYARITAYTRRDNYDVPFTNALVTVLTREPGQNSYAGFKAEVTDDYGTACVLTYCGSEATVYVESGGDRLLPKEEDDLNGYEYIANRDNMTFNVVYRDINGPIFRAQERARCEERKGENYHFKFAPEVLPPVRLYVDSTVVYHQRNWYPELNHSPNRKACFLKAKFTDKRFDTRLLAMSGWNAKGEDYQGGYEASPQSNQADGQNQDNKAVCLEFKCSGNIYGDEGEEIPNVATTMSIFFTQNNGNCRYIGRNPLFDTEITDESTHVQFKPKPGNEYGESYGIYMGHGQGDTMYETGLAYCRSGMPGGDNEMNPDTGFAIEYECD